jgi:hypothetical protein
VGKVVIHVISFNGRGWSYQGTVNAAGEVSAPALDRILSRTIHDRVFAGQQANHWCTYRVQMQKDLAAAGN